jgi:Protein of unknown function (DUF1488)
MNSTAHTTSGTRPRWDGSRVWFEITDGDEHIACAITRAALQDLAEGRYHNGSEMLQCFIEARGRIEELARSKLKATPHRVTGPPLSLWADDIDDLPPSGAPMAAHRFASPRRQAHAVQGS